MKHSKGRVAGLSDGIFAFASTLMVVDIGTAVDFKNISSQSTLFISFGIAFFVMMMLWKVHYNFFQRTKYIDNWIIAANVLLLFTILFYLFPLKTLVNSIVQKIGMMPHELSQLFLIYGLGFSIIFLSYSFLYWRAYKKDIKNKNRMKLKFYCRHFSIYVFVGLLSTLIAIIEIGIRIGLPGFAYILLGPLCYYNSIRFRKKYPKAFI